MSNPTIKINNKQVACIYTSSGWLSKIEDSNRLIWEKTDMPVTDLCVTILEPDIKNYLYIKLNKDETDSTTYTLNYSFISDSVFSSVTTNPNGDGYINFSTNNSIFLESTQFPTWVGTSSISPNHTYYTTISCKRRTGDDPDFINDEDIPFIISGNVDSLGRDSGPLPANKGYYRLFASSKLVDASMLKLRHTEFIDGTMGYQGMFGGCESLIKAPELPATTLASNCYNSMFYGCTSLTTAPELPATTLASYCYFGMFANCTALTTAPDLLANTLVYGCYVNMFYGCTNLNYIKCTADINIITSNISNWTHGVSASGTFCKKSGVTWWTTGTSGIPSGWNVIEV